MDRCEDTDEWKKKKKKTYLWDRWGWWTQALRMQMCCVCAQTRMRWCVVLVCGCVACGRVGLLMLLPADADECKQKRKKNLLEMVDVDALHASTLV